MLRAGPPLSSVFTWSVVADAVDENGDDGDDDDEEDDDDDGLFPVKPARFLVVR